MLLGWTDVCVDVQAVSFVQLTRQTAPWEQSHRSHAEETQFWSALHPQKRSGMLQKMHVKASERARPEKSGACAQPAPLTMWTGTKQLSYHQLQMGWRQKQEQIMINTQHKWCRDSTRPHDEVATQPNANFNLLKPRLHLLCGEQT